MDLLDTATLTWDEIRDSHRAGRIAFRHIFHGDPATADHYELFVARLDQSYRTPRHRHPYEQVRLTLTGSFNIAPGVELGAGQVGYFPDATHYGPQQVREEATVLTLQGGGAAGLGFLSLDQLRQGQQALVASGRFEEGVYRREEGPGRRNQDGYEAVWEQVNGRPLAYPGERYGYPVLMTPEHFAWRPVAPGVRERRLGTFTERELRLLHRCVEAGASGQVGRADALTLGYVLSGRGVIGGQPVGPGVALRLPAGEVQPVEAGETLTLFLIERPALDAAN